MNVFIDVVNKNCVCHLRCAREHVIKLQIARTQRRNAVVIINVFMTLNNVKIKELTEISANTMQIA